MSTLEDYADELHMLLREIDFPPAAIAVFSFGGMGGNGVCAQISAGRWRACDLRPYRNVDSREPCHGSEAR